MVPLALLAGLPVAGLAGVAVYADARRRELPVASRRRWSVGVAVASLLGFAAAAALDAAPYRAAAALSGGPVVVTSPLQLLATLLALGSGVTAAAVFAYGFASRVGPPRR